MTELEKLAVEAVERAEVLHAAEKTNATLIVLLRARQLREAVGLCHHLAAAGGG